MNNIKTFDQYLRDKYFKLSEKDKEYLLELDRKYGELAIIFRKEFRAKNVMNLEDEFNKFIEHKKVGEKYFPKLDLEQIESSVDIKAEFEELLTKFENFSSFISKFYVEKIKGFLNSIALSEKYKKMSESKKGVHQISPNSFLFFNILSILIKLLYLLIIYIKY